ncbi:siderophore-interacting protein [Bosea sp. (in: a-proteobacteria)]|jgi:NADPH-dependent ferric siderophore reductase|uniref:siderophore-interacting protein n=1 Tax=Bosea sp. (in: a-proteobacteria) TaxID=1871050 RepID=UPI003F6F3991
MTAHPGAAPMSPPEARYEWLLTVVEVFAIGPRMRRLVFTGEHLDELDYQPGQALVLRMPLPEGGTGRRDYTIRSFDRVRARLVIDFVLHGSAPAANWARDAGPGDTVLAQGPRGRTILAGQADWHLFCGDETGLPAIRHMLETMPAGTTAFVWAEVDGPEDEVPFDSAAALTVEWVQRNGARPGPSRLLLDRLAGFSLPPGRGQAYLIGETSNVRAQRHHLVARGMERGQIASEGYWRPGRIGGHDHVDD